MDARKTLLPLGLALLMTVRPGTGQSIPTGHDSSIHRSTEHAVAIGVAALAIPTGIGVLTFNAGGAGVALLLSAGILGPAPGLFYAGNDDKAWAGMGLRALTLAIGAGGVAIMAASFDPFGGDSAGGFAAGAMVGLVAAGFTVASWIIDLREIPPSVARFNTGLEATPVLTLDGRVGAQLTFRW